MSATATTPVKPKKPIQVRLDTPEFRQDPNREFARLVGLGPLVRMKLPIIGSTWTLTTYEAVDRFLRDSDRFVRDPARGGRRLLAGMQWWIPRSFRALGNNMMAKDGDEHRRLRLLVDQAFLRRNVDSMKPRIAEIADTLIDQLEQQQQQHGQVDYFESFARQLPLTVICELLGLPEADRPKFQQWFAPISKVKNAWGFFRMLPGMAKTRRYLRERIQISRRRDANDCHGLIDDLVHAEESGDKLNDDELLAMIFLLLVAGYETTAHLLGVGMLLLLQHPSQLERLKADWSLAPTAVDEMLRFGSGVQLSKPRFAAEDMELYGQRIRRGELLIACLASANLDPAEFPNPETFDIARSPNRHVSFGKGIHTCLGMRLAQVEIITALERLFTRHPDIQAALPFEQTPWTFRIGLRTLSALPLRLDG